ncbi:hypothetical protein JK364_23145 [Streptomyces sp. 110]|uniref:Uncharacterized protein n=1 Tax=Streptomyces endocoffeicus TaxID=2898945 RepID=A0ABS1PU67_9ACTN|nr:DUF6415 family natural product biosynthesis protein [Streptomyces endocoffeicus]MBL1115271.1 hypothetical protein [Streptomyces endocoffeicus]
MTGPGADGLPVKREAQTPVVDRATMRARAALLLAPGVEPPTGEALAALKRDLRDDIAALLPEVEKAALGLRKGDLTRAFAMVCCCEARTRLTPLGTARDPTTHTTLLARSVNALLDHLERLGAQR